MSPRVLYSTIIIINSGSNQWTSAVIHKVGQWVTRAWCWWRPQRLCYNSWGDVHETHQDWVWQRTWWSNSMFQGSSWNKVHFFESIVIWRWEGWDVCFVLGWYWEIIRGIYITFSALLQFCFCKCFWVQISLKHELCELQVLVSWQQHQDFAICS